MNRDALGPALVALLAIVALGIGASALDTRSSGENIGRGGGSTGIGEGSTFGLGQPSPIETSEGLTIPKLVLQLLIIALFVMFLVGLYLWRDNLRGLGTIVATIAILIIGIALFFKYTNLNPDGKLEPSGTVGFFEQPLALPGGGSGSASTEALSVTSDSLLLALAVAGMLIIGVIVIFRSRDDDSTPEIEPGEAELETVTELGYVAGRAADRIADDADLTNEVYWAWKEMTDRLEVSNPKSQTPSEFARAATDTGMAKEDVDELTDLFRTVRYGGSDPTGERETRAVSALRRIEDEYGGES